jgi:hypothetical protein
MFGIITIAQGDKRYVEMAKALALSLIKTNPEIKRGVITDAAQQEFDGLYDIYIPYNESYGKGLNQKLYLDKYSPFEETLFIDADCLVVTSLNNMLTLCRNYTFVVFGGPISTDIWYMDVAATCNKFNLSSIPLFNGGTYYFKNGSTTTCIYDKARELKENYTENGFEIFRGSINEEPLIAVAMAINNTEAIEDNGIGMRTPIGILGPLQIDVLNNKCRFNKEGEMVEPAIMHFSGAYSAAFHYKRELAKLKAYNIAPFLGSIFISFIINLIFNVPYITYIFCKRILKVLIRKEKFDFSNSLPIFSNQ